MLEALIIILIIGWLLGFFALHVTGGLIHLLLVVAVVAIIIRLFQGGRRSDPL